jgi:hypothetical protein
LFFLLFPPSIFFSVSFLSEFAKRVEDFKKRDAEEKKKKKDHAATTIQALARGVISRKVFRKNLPNMKTQQKLKILCVQCETQIAIKRCRQCRDRFCNECYDLIHQKGNRKTHSWENIKVDTRMLAMAYDTKDPQATNVQSKSTFSSTARQKTMIGTDPTNATGSGAAKSNDPPAKKVNPKDWEEFFDESARAKYWYNKKTGEASWVNPLK